MDMKGIDLFKIFSEGNLPPEGGYIVTAFFQEGLAYATYEIVGYSGKGQPTLSEGGLSFPSDANKVFVLAEPVGYDKRDVEPLAREPRFQIPHRFAELELLTAANMSRVMFSRQPLPTYFSFFVPRPAALNFSLLFPRQPEALNQIAAFFEESLNEIADVPRGDAAVAARRIVEVLKRFTVWPKPEEKAPVVAAAEKAPPAPAPAAPAVPKPEPKAVPEPSRPAPVIAKPKAAVKKPAAKKPAVKKAPVKKAVKKAAPKKAAKKVVAKKPVAKKPVAKKAAPKKVAAKKLAKKPAAKKAAAKKSGGKIVKKATAKRPAVKKPAAKKAATKKPKKATKKR